MTGPTRTAVARWIRLGPRFLPFADVATPELPLSRLLRLALFQVSVGMALVLCVGTLNRVMIVELGVAASVVAIMVSLPVVYAPFRALVGFRSDHHRSAIGWKRVPYMWLGTLIQFGGLAIMPFALLVLGGGGESKQWPAWMGPAGAGLAFLLVGAGLHTTQTAGLALATDLAEPEARPRVVGLMYVMLLIGTMISALLFGAFLRDFTPARLIQVIQAAAVLTLVLNTVAMWRQEALQPRRRESAPDVDFAAAWRHFIEADGTRRRLAAIALGTMAFAMQDVLLEPYGGQILGLSVGATTWITATMAFGGLAGFGLASAVLARGADPARMARAGAAIGLPAFLAIILSAPAHSVALYAVGALLVGFGGGVFSHGTLTLTMNLAPKAQAGLALGAWGAVQGTAAGVAVALGGIGRDAIGALALQGHLGAALATPATGFSLVYSCELLLLVATVVVMGCLVGTRRPLTADAPAGRAAPGATMTTTTPPSRSAA